jgi:2-haloalkanoic acid dehalogenase type II
MIQPAPPPLRAVVFDAYGTLFDVAAAARRAGTEPGGEKLADVWPRLAEDWRRKQLEYTWLRAASGDHADFGQVTEDGLDWALDAADLAGEADLRARLLDLYLDLDCFPEVAGVLNDLRGRGLRLAILSNGTEAMLARATQSAGIDALFDAVLSVDTVGVFKPAPRVYDLVEQRLGVSRDAALFVSANGWDAGCAAGYGFATYWVNRAGAPVDRLTARPDHEHSDLTALPRVIDTWPRPADPPRRFTASDGLSLAYRDEGVGPPLLCLCGLTRNMADFDDVARDFSGRARIIRLDTRGRGASDYDPDFNNYNIAREAQDAIDLLDHLGLDRAAILGTSRGGLIAMALAASHRDRLSGVCLNDIGPEIDTTGLGKIMGYLGLPPGHATLEDGARAMAAAQADLFPDVPLDRWRTHATRIWLQTPTGLALRYDRRLRDAVIAQSATGGMPDLWPLFDLLAGLPLALIRGANSDLLSAATAAEMQRRRPDMIAADVPNRGHVPFLDEPEAQAVIAAFLDRLA